MYVSVNSIIFFKTSDTDIIFPFNTTTTFTRGKYKIIPENFSDKIMRFCTTHENEFDF